MDELLRTLGGDLGLYYLHGQGLGSGGLERIHDRVRRLERVRPGGRRPGRLHADREVPTASAQARRSRA
ncbi:hypothetical protein [Streptomyces sp. NPDC040750]|uniref:hypothetical protein n=1 Tax=Streptomyces sp. NPDC040750 TaxID=3154491 RepID=UPI003408EFD4